jgi:hypothetical protein
MKSILQTLALVTLVVVGCAHRQAAHPQELPKVAYIPKDLADAHHELAKMLPTDEIQHIQAMTNRHQMVEYHMGLGLRLRNEWGLWHESRLARYFTKLGVDHADGMSALILATFWCKLHGVHYNLGKMTRSPKEHQEYLRSREAPAEGSPRDGARIVWLITKHPGSEFEVHLGISTSDGSYWRYQYKSGRGIELPTEEDRKDLDELKETWKKIGTKFEDFTTK